MSKKCLINMDKNSIITDLQTILRVGNASGLVSFITYAVTRNKHYSYFVSLTLTDDVPRVFLFAHTFSYRKITNSGRC